MSAPRLLAVGRALPAHRYRQEELTAVLMHTWGDAAMPAARLAALQSHCGVEFRHFAVPVEQLQELRSFAQANDLYLPAALQLAAQAARDALARARVKPEEIDRLLLVSTTGVATPSLDARLIFELGLREDVRRLPLFGLGCAGGAAALSQAADLLRGNPHETVLAVCVELCSLTFQQGDRSTPNAIATGLFGDGAAALVLAGAESPARAGVSPGPEVLGARSRTYPRSERVMGWDVVDSGFKIILSSGIPELLLMHLGGETDALLESVGAARANVSHWIFHTGGPKVLQAIQTALALPEGALSRSWAALRRMGNISSPSVLFVLADLLEAGEAKPGQLGVLAAVGPGFSSELVALRW